MNKKNIAMSAFVQNLRFSLSMALPLAILSLLVASPLYAALPFPLKAGHPRVYLDQARIDSNLKPAAQAQLPLDGANFPQTAGTLTFDLYVPPPSADGNGNLPYPGTPIFDGFDPARNHIFVGHRDWDNTTINGVLDKVAISIVFQDKTSNQFGYWVVLLTPSTWHTVTIHWNTTTLSLGAIVDAGMPQAQSYTVYTGSVPADWTPRDQKFVFTGREDRIDNIKLYSTDTANPDSLAASYPLDEGNDVYAADVSGRGHAARLGSSVVWTTRSVADTNPVIQINGVASPFTVIADSPLTDSWSGVYRQALGWANVLNSGGTATNIQTTQGAGITNIARSLGLAYLVTGDLQFRTALLKYTDQILAVVSTVDSKGNISYPGGDDSQSGRVEALGIIYDWLYDIVTTTPYSGGGLYSDAIAQHIKDEISAFSLRQSVCGFGNKIADDWSGCVTAYDAAGNPLPPTPVQPAPYLHGHPHFNDAYISSALIAIIGEHPELQNLLDILYYDFSSVFNPALEYFSVDGGHHYGWSYGALYSFLDPILLWQNAGASMAAPWQGKLIYRYIYGLRGDLHYPASGDDYHIGLADERVVAQALWASTRSSDGYAQYYFDRWIKPYLGNGSVSEILFSLSASQATPHAPDDLPYSRLFRNAGQVLMRDTWDYRNSTLFEFKSTSYWTFGHQHMDQNAFTVFYKAPLLIDSGYYGAYGTTHWENYYTRTIAHNSIIVFDPGEIFVKPWASSPNRVSSWWSNDGGQQFFGAPLPTLQNLQPPVNGVGGSNHLDGVTVYEYQPEFTYTVGNASKAYNPAKLDQASGFVRSIIFLRNPSFWSKPVTVVFDKVSESSVSTGPFVKRFLLHTANEPEPLGGAVIAPGQYQIAGNTVTVRNGGGMLFSQTLLPENPVLTKVGGKDASGDYRFLVPNNVDGTLTNYPPSPEPPATNTDVGAWRIEVTAPVPSKREYFLHVLSVADNGAVPAPPLSQNLSSDNAAVALLNSTHTIAFSKSDVSAASISWNTPVVDSKIMVAGLMPNATYSGSIATNGSSVSPYTITFAQDQNGQFLASAQGVLTVNSSLAQLGTDLAVSISATPSPVNQGSIFTYTATVTNNGPSSASAVMVSGLTGCTLSSSSIPSGGTSSCSVSVAANTVGTNTQTVSVSGAEVDPNTANNTASVTVTVNPSADLAITMTGTPNPVFAGQSLTYSITITNNGPSTATGIILNDYLPLGMLPVTPPTASQGTCTSGQTVTCSLDTLLSGAIATVSIVVQPVAVGTFVNTASVTGSQFDPNMGNNNTTAGFTTVDPAADLAITLIDSPDPVTLGQTVTYTTTVTNLGPSPASGGTATGTLPTCNIGPLAVNASQSCPATVTASSMTLPTQTMSINWIDFDPNGLNNSASASTTVIAPDLISSALTVATSGTNLLVNDRITNQGSGASGAFTVSYYFSTDTSYQASDTLLCSRSISGLAAGIASPATGTTQTSCPIPSIPGGSYYVIAIVDSGSTVTESNEGNNAASAAVTISGVDLLPLNLSASRASGSNTKVNINEAVKNQGKTNAGGFTIRYYLSTDTTYSSDDLALVSSSGGPCTRKPASLAAGATSTGSKVCYKPSSGIVSGTTYNVLIVNDWGTTFPGGSITEYNETNNVGVAGTVQW